jgi:hypothetical protein
MLIGHTFFKTVPFQWILFVSFSFISHAECIALSQKSGAEARVGIGIKKIPKKF